jgi:exopolyphosphatase/guanosine-5'-triphosphate,3'-diphosphate pyrophosphatase
MTTQPASPSPTVSPAGGLATRRVAAVDIGSNSIRLLVAEVRSDGTYRLLDDEKVVARLGRGMAHSPRLDEAAMQEAAKAIARMKAIAEGYGAIDIRAVATCAVREAENRDAFTDLVRQTAGLDVEVISGEEEGRLALLSVRSAFDIEKSNVAVIDLGGGSTEVVISAGGIVDQITSLPLGAVRLTDAVRDAASPDAAAQAIGAIVKRELKARLPKPDLPVRRAIGTGGTFTTLAAMDLHRRGQAAPGDAPARVRGHELALVDVRRWHDRLAAMEPRERAEVPGLGADRADIIVAGLAITAGVMQRLGVNAIQVHDRGIRDGLLLSLTRDLFPGAAPRAAGGVDRIAAARDFAEACRYERDHAEHVTRLALSIHDQIVRALPDLPKSVSGAAGRDVLHAAAILHDVGYFINYHRHHKHSYHLILHSELPGFHQRELELIANVARYHRRGHPKRSHPGFERLSAEERLIVRHLAAILRVADGLDRAHAGNVTSVDVRLDRPRLTAWFDVHAAREPEVDLWGAARKSRLFMKVLGLEPRFEWIGA